MSTACKVRLASFMTIGVLGFCTATSLSAVGDVPSSILRSVNATPQPTRSDADMAEHYDLIVFQNWAADRVHTIKKLNPKVKVLFYRAGHITWDWQENWSVINTHEAWFMHAPGGQRTRNSDVNDHYYVMDIRNPEFRAYQIQYVMKFVNASGFDGVFWDGPPGAIAGWLTLNPGYDRSAADTWHHDILRFLREMKQALGPHLLITNSTPTYDSGIPGVDDSDFLAIVDGTLIEGFAHAQWDPFTTTPGAAWDWQQRMAQRNVSAGKYLMTISGVDAAPAEQLQRWRVFSLGSFLLKADGIRTYYEWGGSREQAPIFPEMNAKIGTPIGPATQANGVWQRDFTGGKVLVNPSDASHTIALGTPFRSLTGTTVTTATLSPWTATILQR